LKNDVNVPLKSNKPKNLLKNSFFVGVLKVNDENSSIRIRIRIHQSEAWIRGLDLDPDPHQNVMEPQHNIEDSPKSLLLQSCPSQGCAANLSFLSLEASAGCCSHSRPRSAPVQHG
jgi:hypothetical protein